MLANINTLCFIFFQILFKLTKSATYYIDVNHPNSADTNSGRDENSPWKTIKHSETLVAAGDTIYVKSGLYYEGASPDWSIPTINPSQSGTSTNPIRYIGLPNSNNDAIRLATGSFGAAESDYIFWEGFVAEHAKVFHCVGCRIINCEIIGTFRNTGDNHDGIRIQDSSDVIIQGNLIRAVTGLSPNSAGIKLYDTTNITIEDNFIHHNTAGIFDKDSGIRNTYRRNLVKDNEEQGFYGNNQDQYGEYYIYDNVFYSTIQLHYMGNHSQVHNNIVFDNCLAGSWAGDVNNIKLWNNIVITPDTTNPIQGYADGQDLLIHQISYMDFNLYNSDTVYAFDYYNLDPITLSEMNARGFEQNSFFEVTSSELWENENNWELRTVWETAGRYSDKMGPKSIDISIIMDETRYGTQMNVGDIPFNWVPVVIAIGVSSFLLFVFIVVLVITITIIIVIVVVLATKNAK